MLRPDMIELAEPGARVCTGCAIHEGAVLTHDEAVARWSADVNDLIRALQVAIARVPTVDSTCVLLVVAAMASLCVRFCPRGMLIPTAV